MNQLVLKLVEKMKSRINLRIHCSCFMTEHKYFYFKDSRSGKSRIYNNCRLCEGIRLGLKLAVQDAIPRRGFPLQRRRYSTLCSLYTSARVCVLSYQYSTELQILKQQQIIRTIPFVHTVLSILLQSMMLSRLFSTSSTRRFDTNFHFLFYNKNNCSSAVFMLDLLLYEI